MRNRQNASTDGRYKNRAITREGTATGRFGNHDETAGVAVNMHRDSLESATLIMRCERPRMAGSENGTKMAGRVSDHAVIMLRAAASQGYARLQNVSANDPRHSDSVGQVYEARKTDSVSGATLRFLRHLTIPLSASRTELAAPLAGLGVNTSQYFQRCAAACQRQPASSDGRFKTIRGLSDRLTPADTRLAKVQRKDGLGRFVTVQGLTDRAALKGNAMQRFEVAA
jgi:hypothetical protein